MFIIKISNLLETTINPLRMFDFIRNNVVCFLQHSIKRFSGILKVRNIKKLWSVYV